MKPKALSVVISLLLLSAAFSQLCWGQQLRTRTALKKAAKDLTPGRAYSLGVKLGQASVHALVSNYQAAGFCLQALKFAREVSRQLLAVIPDFKISRYQRPIYICTRGGREGGDMQRHWDTYRASLEADIIHLREHADLLLKQKKNRWRLSFKLGEAMGIAEGQAAVGDSARSLVRDALNRACGFAADLNLDTVSLTHIIKGIDGGEAMSSIHNRVAAVRGRFQNLLR